MNEWMSEFRVALRSLPHQEKSLSSRVWCQTIEWGERKGEKDRTKYGEGCVCLSSELRCHLLFWAASQSLEVSMDIDSCELGEGWEKVLFNQSSKAQAAVHLGAEGENQKILMQFYSRKWLFHAFIFNSIFIIVAFEEGNLYLARTAIN